MKILAIDTSGKTASVAIIEDEKLIIEIFLDRGLTHSQTILSLIDSGLNLSGTTLDDVDVLAVGRGPGSFTGVRIGISVIKGLAVGGDKKIMDVCSLEALANNISYQTGIICPVMDARRNQVYGGVFSFDEEGVFKKLHENVNISLEEYFQLLLKQKNFNKNIFFVGDGAKMCYNYGKSMNLSNINLELAPKALRLQRASSTAQLALRQIIAGEKLKTSDQLLPDYLRLPQAQREREEKLN